MRSHVEFKEVSQRDDLETLVGQLRDGGEETQEHSGGHFIPASLHGKSQPGHVEGIRYLGRSGKSPRGAHKATRAAFVELDRQVETYKSDVRGGSLETRTTAKTTAEEKAAGASTEIEGGEGFFDRVSPHIETLSHFIRHMLAYWQVRGDVTAARTSS